MSASAFPLKGEADEGDQALPLPRLAGGRHPGRGERHDRHHRLSAETAAAVWEPSHRRTLQVFEPFYVGILAYDSLKVFAFASYCLPLK